MYPIFVVVGAVLLHLLAKQAGRKDVLTWTIGGGLLTVVALLCWLARDKSKDGLAGKPEGATNPSGDIPRMACRDCGEMIAVSARKCRFCNSAAGPALGAVARAQDGAGVRPVQSLDAQHQA